LAYLWVMVAPCASTRRLRDVEAVRSSGGSFLDDEAGHNVTPFICCSTRGVKTSSVTSSSTATSSAEFTATITVSSPVFWTALGEWSRRYAQLQAVRFRAVGDLTRPVGMLSLAVSAWGRVHVYIPKPLGVFSPTVPSWVWYECLSMAPFPYGQKCAQCHFSLYHNCSTSLGLCSFFGGWVANCIQLSFPLAWLLSTSLGLSHTRFDVWPVAHANWAVKLQTCFIRGIFSRVNVHPHWFPQRSC